MKKLTLLLGIIMLTTIAQAGSFNWQDIGETLNAGIGDAINPSIAIGCENFQTGLACTNTPQALTRDSIHAVFESTGEIFYTKFDWIEHEWKTPKNISNTTRISLKPYITLDSQNNPYVVWEENTQTANEKEIYFNHCIATQSNDCTTNPQTTWITPENVSQTPNADSIMPDIAIGPNLIPIVAWIDGKNKDTVSSAPYGAIGGNCAGTFAGEEQTQLHVRKRTSPTKWFDMAGNPTDGWINEHPNNTTQIYNSDTGLVETDNIGDYRRCNQKFAKLFPDIDVNGTNVVHIAYENKRLGVTLASWVGHIEWDGSKWLGGLETIPAFNNIPEQIPEFSQYADFMQIGGPVIDLAMDINSSGHIFVTAIRDSNRVVSAPESKRYNWILRARRPAFIQGGGGWGAFKSYFPNYAENVQDFYEFQLDGTNTFKIVGTAISPNNLRTENRNNLYLSIGYKNYPTTGENFDAIVRAWDGHKKFNALNDVNHAFFPIGYDILTPSIAVGETDGNLFIIYTKNDGANTNIEIKKWEKDINSSQWLQAEDFLLTSPPALPDPASGYKFPPEDQEYYCNFSTPEKPHCNEPPFNMQEISLTTPTNTECRTASNDKNFFIETFYQNIDKAYCKTGIEPYTLAIPPTIKDGNYFFSLGMTYPKINTDLYSRENPELKIRIWGEGISSYLELLFETNIITGEWTNLTLPNEFKAIVPRNAFISFQGGTPTQVIPPQKINDKNVYIDRFRFDEETQEFEEINVANFKYLGLEKISTNSPIVEGQDISFSIDWKQEGIGNFNIFVCNTDNINDCQANSFGELYCPPINVIPTQTTGTDTCAQTQNTIGTYPLHVFACTTSLTFCTNPSNDEFKVKLVGERDVDIFGVINVSLNKNNYTFTDTINVSTNIQNFDAVERNAELTITFLNPTTGTIIDTQVYNTTTPLQPGEITTLTNIASFDLTNYTLIEDLHSIRITATLGPGENVITNNSKTTQFALTATEISSTVAVPEIHWIMIPILLIIVLLILNKNSFKKRTS
jgi:hypothetical protein